MIFYLHKIFFFFFLRHGYICTRHLAQRREPFSICSGGLFRVSALLAAGCCLVGYTKRDAGVNRTLQTEPSAIYFGRDVPLYLFFSCVAGARIHHRTARKSKAVSRPGHDTAELAWGRVRLGKGKGQADRIVDKSQPATHRFFIFLRVRLGKGQADGQSTHPSRRHIV